MNTNISDEQSLNAALALTTEGVTNSFRFTRWIIRHRDLLKINESGTNKLLDNACSMYRGGYYEGDGEKLRELFTSLAQGTETQKDGNFVFLGDDTDLSYFWKKTGKHEYVTLSDETISQIDDTKLRYKVKKSLDMAYLNGKLNYDKGVYELNSSGNAYIHSPDFIEKRLRGEGAYFSKASEALEDIDETIKADKLKLRLSELGLEGVYDDHYRITLNRDKLYIGQSEGNMQFFVPGTKRKMTVSIPSSDVIKLDENTYCAFLKKSGTYSVNNGGKNERLDSSFLLKHFELKSKNRADRTIFEKAEKSVADEKDIIPNKELGGDSFDVDEFMDLALKRSYKEFKPSGQDISPNTGKLKLGQVYEMYMPNGELKQFVPTRQWTDHEGVEHINFKSVTGDINDVLLPEDAYGRIVFDNKEQAMKVIGKRDDMCKRYHTLLDRQLMPEHKEKRKLDVFFKKNTWRDAGDKYIISGKHPETFEVPKQCAAPQNDGTLGVRINEGDTYRINTGKYSYTVSGDAFARSDVFDNTMRSVSYELSDKIPDSRLHAVSDIKDGVKQSAKGVSQGVKEATHTVEKGAEAVGNGIKTVTQTTSDIASHTPPVGVVSTAVNVISKAVSVTTKTVSVAQKTHTLSQKL